MASPAPIAEFWSNTLARARDEPLDASIERVEEPVPFEQYRLVYRSLGGVRVVANLALPIRGELVDPAPLPAIVTAPGYGGREHGVMLAECQRGYAVLQVFPRGQGASADLWQLDRPDKLASHLGQPEGHYYQGGYVDVVRGIDYLATRDDVDPTRIAAVGTSQGGGIALAVAGIDARVRAVVAHVPFLCDMRRSAKTEGSLVRALLEQHAPVPGNALDTLDYFEPLNVAHSIIAPALLSSGGRDATCPPESVRAVFDRIAGIKSLAHYPDLGHTSCGAFYDLTWNWLDRYVRST